MSRRNLRNILWLLTAAVLCLSGCRTGGPAFLQTNKIFSPSTWGGGAPSGQWEPEISTASDSESPP